jgi:lipoprotein Spr
MKRVLSYRICLYLIGSVFLLDGCSSSKKAASSKPVVSSVNEKKAEREKRLKETYANLLGVSPRDIDNMLLYSFIDEWYGVPYKYAGKTKEGIDCSDFVSALFDHVYGTTLAGNCTNLYSQCKPIKEEDLKEGDLVFFKINSKDISHVGIYLQNHHFVHASVHSGIVISDLNMDYYKKYFYKGGRLKISLSQNSYKG